MTDNQTATTSSSVHVALRLNQNDMAVIRHLHELTGIITRIEVIRLALRLTLKQLDTQDKPTRT